jgi:Antitoxin VbhA
MTGPANHEKTMRKGRLMLRFRSPREPTRMKLMSPEERARRAADVENALASVRIEGLEPGDDAKAIFRRYIEGELTLAEMGAAIDALHDQLYGPVRLSRD